MHTPCLPLDPESWMIFQTNTINTFYIQYIEYMTQEAYIGHIFNRSCKSLIFLSESSMGIAWHIYSLRNRM